MIATTFDYAAMPKVAVACPLCATENAGRPQADRYGYPIGLSQCACGMVYLNPRMTAEGYGEFYRETYRPLVTAWSGPVSTKRSVERGTMLGHFVKGPVSRLLDVGGGTGDVAMALAKAVGCADVTVIDPNAEELQHATARGCATVHGLIEQMPPSTARYDLIVSLMTSDHWLDPLAALRWMRGALADGGRMVVDIVDVRAFQRECPLAAWTKVDHPLYWTPKSMTAALTQTGWKVVRAWCESQSRRRRFFECRGV